MENASKALLMAAGVLIGILIISLAIYLFFSFGSTSKELHEIVEQNEIKKFNGQFTQYEESNENTIHDIVTTIRLAQEFNQKNECMNDGDPGHISVKIQETHKENANETEINNMIEQANNTIDITNQEIQKYKAKVKYNRTTGYVEEIKFESI